MINLQFLIFSDLNVNSSNYIPSMGECDIFWVLKQVRRENIFIMQNNQYLPNITSRIAGREADSYLRRRNLSLSTSQQPEPVSERTGLHTQQRCDFVYASRKNQLMIKKARFKGKDLTRLCQDNLAQYLSLKSKVTEPYSSPAQHLQKVNKPQKQKSFKLSVKLFNLPSSFTPGRSPRNCDFRPKTQNSPILNEQQEDNRSVSVGVGTPIKGGSVSKKYSQMSLKQIVEGENNFQLFTRIKDFKSKIRESLKRSRKESQEYEIEGW